MVCANRLKSLFCNVYCYCRAHKLYLVGLIKIAGIDAHTERHIVQSVVKPRSQIIIQCVNNQNQESFRFLARNRPPILRKRPHHRCHPSQTAYQKRQQSLRSEPFEQVVFPHGSSKKLDATATLDHLVTRLDSSSVSRISKGINFFYKFDLNYR